VPIKQMQMKLAVMTHSTFFVEEDKILTTLFNEGMENLHLCKWEASPIYSERLLSLLNEDNRKRTTVHDNFYLKNEFELGGIHLDTIDTPIPEGYKGKVSRTCGDLSLLKDTVKISKYVFFSNFLLPKQENSDIKTYSLDLLEKAAKSGYINKNVYAMGNINLETIPVAKALGFGGVVLCEDLWNRFDIQNQTDYRDLIHHFQKIKRAIG
jgi:thiamine phosphate pyrophosphorylase